MQGSYRQFGQWTSYILWIPAAQILILAWFLTDWQAVNLCPSAASSINLGDIISVFSYKD